MWILIIGNGAQWNCQSISYVYGNSLVEIIVSKHMLKFWHLILYRGNSRKPDLLSKPRENYNAHNSMHNQTISIIMLLNSTLYQYHMLQNLTHQLYYHDLRMNPHKMTNCFLSSRTSWCWFWNFLDTMCASSGTNAGQKYHIVCHIIFHILGNSLQHLPRFVSLFRKATNEKGGINLCLLEYYWNETLFL